MVAITPNPVQFLYCCDGYFSQKSLPCCLLDGFEGVPQLLQAVIWNNPPAPNLYWEDLCVVAFLLCFLL